jgi:integrase
LRSFYRWAVLTGRVDENPAERLPVVRATQPKARPAADDDLAAALRRADDRELLALRLAAELGMRRGEVAVVHSRDIIERSTNGPTLIVHGKGRQDREVPLTEALARTLRACGEGYVFPGRDAGHISPRYLGKLISALLPAGVTMHQLRHRFATLAYSVDRDVFAVQQLLGHASPMTTQRYVLVPHDAQRRLVEIVAARAS